MYRRETRYCHGTYIAATRTSSWLNCVLSEYDVFAYATATYALHLLLATLRGRYPLFFLPVCVYFEPYRLYIILLWTFNSLPYVLGNDVDRLMFL